MRIFPIDIFLKNPHFVGFDSSLARFSGEYRLSLSCFETWDPILERTGLGAFSVGRGEAGALLLLSDSSAEISSQTDLLTPGLLCVPPGDSADDTPRLANLFGGNGCSCADSDNKLELDADVA